jgi:hypothetical protein
VNIGKPIKVHEIAIKVPDWPVRVPVPWPVPAKVLAK